MSDPGGRNLTCGLLGSLGMSLVYSYRFSGLAVVFGALLLFHNRFGYGLLQFPGPFWASVTNFWRFREAYRRGRERPMIMELHAQYGDVVRLGPKALSFASPGAIDAIYGPKANMVKVGCRSGGSLQYFTDENVVQVLQSL